MTLNSVTSARRIGIEGPERLIVAVLDNEAGDIIAAGDDGVTVLPVNELDSWRQFDLPVENEYRPYATEGFSIAALARYPVIEHLLETRKRPVVYADGDTVFLRNPLTYLARLQPRLRGVVLMQNDRPASVCRDGWQAQYPVGERAEQSIICTGFMVWLPERGHLKMLKAVLHSILSEASLPIDQDVVNRLSKEWPKTFQLLRQDLFPNGSLWLPPDYTVLSDKSQPDFDWRSAYVVHANFTYGLETKVAALKAMGLWYLEEKPET